MPIAISRDGYAVFGSCDGGDLVVPELRLKFSFRSGYVFFAKGQMLQHFITERAGKTREVEQFCITHFTGRVGKVYFLCT